MSPRRPPQPEKIKHIFRIESWKFDYLFGVDVLPSRPGEYLDSRYLELEGHIIEPAKITAKRGKITCSPQASLIGVDRPRVAPTKEKSAAVGAVYYRGKEYNAHLFFPGDMLPAILLMLSVEKYRYVIFEASKTGSEVFHFTFSEAAS